MIAPASGIDVRRKRLIEMVRSVRGFYDLDENGRRSFLSDSLPISWGSGEDALLVLRWMTAASLLLGRGRFWQDAAFLNVCAELLYSIEHFVHQHPFNLFGALNDRAGIENLRRTLWDVYSQTPEWFDINGITLSALYVILFRGGKGEDRPSFDKFSSKTLGRYVKKAWDRRRHEEEFGEVES